MQLRAALDRLGDRAIVALAPVIAFAFTAGAILSSPYRGDDVVNKEIHQSTDAGRSLFELIGHYTEYWAQSQGRFFPGSVSWTLGLFYLFDTRVEYKLVLALVLGLAVAALTFLVLTLTRAPALAAVAALSALAVLQVRDGHDGLTAFAGLLPLTSAMVFAVCVVLLRRSGPWWGLLAGAVYGLALVTYETTILFSPAIVALVVVATRSWWRAVPVLVPVVLDLAVVLFLRSQVGNTLGSAYTVALDPGVVLVTFAKQLLAPLPGSQWVLGDALRPPVALVVFCVVLVGVPVYLAARVLVRRDIQVSQRTIVLLAGFGLWMWVSSAGLIAITDRWQRELQWGDGYLSVIYGYFGLALCLTATWAAVTRALAADSGGRIARTWRIGAPGLLALLCALTAAGNLAVAGS